MSDYDLTEFFKLDGRKTMITLVFVIAGLAILLIFIWLLVLGKSLLGPRPNPIIFGMIAAFSPLFGISITYVYIFKTMPTPIFILVNLLSVVQFFHWYYLACFAAYIQDRFFNRAEMTFYQK